MSTSALDIKNKALSEIHSGALLRSENELSRAAEVTNLWYNQIVETVQAAAHFPSTAVKSMLALVSETEDMIDPEMRYAYALPENYLYPWYLKTYGRFIIRFDPETNRKLLLTNKSEAELVYARKQSVVGHWEPEMEMAVIYGLAHHISGPLTGKRSLNGDLLQKANQLLSQAQANSANRDQDAHGFIPERFARVGYSVSSTPQKYIYPYGPFFSGVMYA